MAEFKINLNPEAFHSWKVQPETREVFKALEEAISIMEKEIGMGGTLSERPGMTMQMTARAVGYIEGIKALLDMEVED